MEHFESTPQTQHDRAFSEVQKVANEGGYELIVLEDLGNHIRFQILSEDQTGLGEEEHREYLAALLEQSDILTPENTTLIVHPNYSINIEIKL